MTDPDRLWTSPWARLLSWLLAAPMALLLLIHPAAMLMPDGKYSHSLLMLVMVGVSGGFIHGVGFRPHYWLWRLLFGPWTAWPLMLAGYGLLLKAQMA